jgi:hypothetical protein
MAEIVLTFMAEGWNVTVYNAVGSLTGFAPVEHCPGPEIQAN